MEKLDNFLQNTHMKKIETVKENKSQTFKNEESINRTVHGQKKNSKPKEKHLHQRG